MWVLGTSIAGRGDSPCTSPDGALSFLCPWNSVQATGIPGAGSYPGLELGSRQPKGHPKEARRLLAGD